MEYTKRDLDLLIILLDNFERLRKDHLYDLFGSCKVLFNSGIFSYSDFFRIRNIVEYNLPPLIDWEHPKKWYPWNIDDTESRIKFLDELIEKIKNSLSI